MFREIGSNFWLKPDQLEEKKCFDTVLRFISEKEDVAYTSSGRGAISLILEQIVPINKKVLLPLYTCESVIMPFIKKKYDIYFFNINTNLSVNKKEFINCVEKYKPGVILLHAYFGFDTLKDIRSEYLKLREMKTVIIEDITHSLFSGFPKIGADYYLASLRKWLPLLDGGVAITIGKKFKRLKSKIHEKLVDLNLKATRLKYEYTKNLDPNLKTQYRKIFYESEELLNRDCCHYPMTDISRSILCKTDFQNLAVKRRHNYLYLIDSLKHNTLLTPLFPHLPQEVVPLYVPVYVKGDQRKLRAYLAEHEVYVPIHWEIPSFCSRQLTDDASYIYNHILSIPCDQRYSPKNLKRIFPRLNEYDASN